MNILFRKNFHAEGGGCKERYGKVGGRHRGNKGHSHGKRSRECGYSVMEEHHALRTHIFLSPSNMPQEYEEEVPPVSPSTLANKRPSVTLMKWAVGGTKRKPSGGRSDFFLNQTDTLTPSRQVSL